MSISTANAAARPPIALSIQAGTPSDGVCVGVGWCAVRGVDVDVDVDVDVGCWGGLWGCGGVDVAIVMVGTVEEIVGVGDGCFDIDGGVVVSTDFEASLSFCCCCCSPISLLFSVPAAPPTLPLSPSSTIPI